MAGEKATQISGTRGGKSSQRSRKESFRSLKWVSSGLSRLSDVERLCNEGAGDTWQGTDL